MPLVPGTKLGQYEVVEAIGAGGMGEVYRARDTKLGRDVAIKVLPEEFARDKERLDRFEREARLLAQLNHANIATLYGLEEHDGQQFIVMELVEGETLAERIARGPIPVDEAIPLFIQIAAGLEAAHEKGIIHRDLKPANIKIGPDGKPKILDFGLAKAFVGDAASVPDSSQSPTLTKGTALGAIMGTAGYMSPEQSKGQPVDKRTDIFAFGCVLYECLTAKKAFEGETIAETLGAIIHKEPDWVALPASTPSNIRRVLQRCFEKDARRRTRDIGDVALDLADIPAEPSRTAEARHGTRWLTVGPVVLLLILASYLAGMWRSTPSVETVWNGERLGGPTVAGFPVVSPDDTLVAFLVLDRGLTQVAVMQPGGSGDSRQLTHDRSRGYAGPPAWSPDSSRIYFDRTGPDASRVFSISGVGDTEERLVLEDATDPRPLPDGSLLAVRNNSEGLRQLIRYRHPERAPVDAATRG